MPENTPNAFMAFVRRHGVAAGLVVVLVGGVAAAAAGMASHPASASAPAPSLSAPVISVNGPGATATAGNEVGASASPAPVPTATPWGHTIAGGPAPTASSAPTQVIHDGSSAQAPTLASWRNYAWMFAAAWANPAGGKDAWLARMAPFATADLMKQFGYTNIANVRPDTVTGVFLEQDGGSTVKFSVTFANQGTSMMGIMVVQPNLTWKVSQVGSFR